MTGLIYTNHRSKMSKKQRAARESLLKEQRAIKKDLHLMKKSSKLSSNYSSISDNRDIPSRGDGIGVATRKDSPVYTGNAMIGLATLHKSNCVPVFSKDDAESIARMRR